MQPALDTLTDDVATNASDIDALEADEDADTVDGLHANELIRVASDVESGDVDNWDGSTEERSAELTAPDQGTRSHHVLRELHEGFGRERGLD